MINRVTFFEADGAAAVPNVPMAGTYVGAPIEAAQSSKPRFIGFSRWTGWRSLGFLAKILVMTMVMTFAANAQSGQTGTPNTTWYNTSTTSFTITNADQLAGLAQIVNATSGTFANEQFANKTINLGDDINLNPYSSWTPIGTPSRPFRGTFNGNNRKITNLRMDNTALQNSGLFGQINNATIRDLTVENVNMVGRCIGVIAGGMSGNSTVSNCHTSGSVTGNGTSTYNFAYAAGIVADMNGGSVTNSTSTCTVSANGFNNATNEGNSFAGGVVALNNGGIISNCSSSGTVTSVVEHTHGTTRTRHAFAGGIVGRVENGGSVSSSHSTGEIRADAIGVVGIIGTGHYRSRAGGIAGLVTGSNSIVSHSYSMGSISAYSSANMHYCGSHAGGVVGIAESGARVAHSYATGTVFAYSQTSNPHAYAGGVAGTVRTSSSITNCYSTSGVSAQAARTSGTGQDSCAGGIAGRFESNSNISDCAALNSSVRAMGGTNRIGRVVGEQEGGTLLNNIAWSGMLGATWSGSGLTHINGLSWTTAEIQTNQTLGNRFTATNGWTTQNGRLPGLFGNVAAMPTHLRTAPSVPQNFTVTTGNARATLSWSAPINDGGSPITRYEVSSNNGVSWVNASLNASYTFSNLTNGSTYTFRVRAVNAIGNGEQASQQVTLPTSPPPVRNLAATPSCNQMTLSWIIPASDGGSPIIRYEVSSNNGTTWITASSATGHTFTGLSLCTSYTLRVRAVNAVGNGDQVQVTASTLCVPGVPQNFLATPGTGNGQITLTWTAPSFNGGSEITRYEVSSNNGTTWVTASSNANHTFSGLSICTTYSFRIRAVNACGNSSQATATATTFCVPSTPQNFAATRGNAQISLSWTAPTSNGGAAITGYQVSRDDGATWVTASSNTGHTFTGLTNGFEYIVCVRAVNIAGNGERVCDTATPCTMPNAPLNFVATRGNTQASLTWNAPANNGGCPIIRYEVQLDDGAWITAASNTAHTFTGLINGTTYTFRVRAVNDAGNGAAATATATPCTTPNAPQNFVATRGNAQLSLSWNAPANFGGCAIIRYEVSRDGGSSWVTANSNTAHTFTGLNICTAYNLRVRAVNDVGAGAQASTIATTFCVPDAPRNFTATPGNEQVVLSWSAPSNNGGSAIIRYEVSSDNGSNWVSASSANGHTFTGLTNGEAYTFRVRAVNIAGNGAEVWLSGIIPTTNSSAPQNFAAAPGNTYVTLSWSVPEDDGGSPITGYEVSKDNGENWIDASSETGHTFVDLTNGQEYFFRVRAVNANGKGASASFSATPRTVPDVPQNLAAASGNRQIVLSWDAPTFDGGSPITVYEVSNNDGIDWVDASSHTGHTFEDLTNGHEYTFRVRAVNEAGSSAETSITAIPFTVPDIPQSFVATAGNSQIMLSWSVPADNGGAETTGYEVSADNGENWIEASSDTEHTFVGLTNGQEYVFRVRVVNAAGYSAEAIVFATPLAVPDVPQDFTAEAGDKQVTLSWQAPANDGGNAITHYWVSNNNGTNWVDASSANGHIFTDLTNGASYTFLVRAANAAGYSLPATVLSTPFTIPEAPQGFTAEAGDEQVTLSWNAPTFDGGNAITHYEVSSDNGATWITASSAMSHIFTDLTNGQEYFFIVRAVNEAGNGYGAFSQATPHEPPPAMYTINISVFAGGAVSANLTTSVADASITLTILPDVGYELETIVVFKTGDDETTVPFNDTDDILSFTMPDFDVTVTASFREVIILPVAYVVTFGVSEGVGSLTVSVDGAFINSGDEVEEGSVVVFTATPAEGYQITEWKSDVTDLTAHTSNIFTLENLSSDAIVTVLFEEIPPVYYDITVSAAANGAVFSNFSSTDAGTTVILSVLPDDGYELDALFVHKTGDDATTVSVDGTISVFSFTMPDYDVTVTATFREIIILPVMHIVIFGVSEGAGSLTVSVDGAFINFGDEVEEGSKVVFTATPAVGYQVKEWKFYDFVIADHTSNVLTFESLTANATVTVSFELIPVTTYTVTFFTVGGNGALTARVNNTTITSGASVAEKNTVIFTATPAAGNKVSEWRINGAVVTGNTSNTYSLLNLSSNHVVTVQFNRLTSTPELTTSTPLRAWTRDGFLHVSGLEIGEVWSVYSVSGALIYQDVAGSDEAEIAIAAQGVYIVQSGDRTVRVVVSR